MPEPDLNQRDSLADFERRDVTLQGKTKLTFVAGSGPAVIVMTEMPGISPEVARFARFVRDAGFTVWMPNLFGDPGRPPTIPRGLLTMARAACVSREFKAFAANESSPVTQWLRACRRWNATRTSATRSRTSTSASSASSAGASACSSPARARR